MVTIGVVVVVTNGVVVTVGVVEVGVKVGGVVVVVVDVGVTVVTGAVKSKKMIRTISLQNVIIFLLL